MKVTGIITWLRGWFDDIYALTGHTHSNYLTSSDITGKQDTSNLSNDISTDASSTTKYPSVDAIKGYVDSLVSSSVSISVINDFDIEDIEDYEMVNTDDVHGGLSFQDYCDAEDISLHPNVIYLVPNQLNGTEFYYEFLVVDDGNDGVFSEMIGTTQVDLSNYLTTSAITQSITNGDTTHTPSGDAVYDALATKLNTSDFSTQLESVIDSLINEAQS